MRSDSRGTLAETPCWHNGSRHKFSYACQNGAVVVYDTFRPQGAAMSVSQLDRAIECLNTALEADRAAVLFMLRLMIPANQALCDHPHVVVHEDRVVGGACVTLLGFLNGVLTAAGIPPIAARWSAPDPTDDGRRRLLGFCPYTPDHVGDQPVDGL